MHISPDMLILWQWGPITLNATIFFTWIVMLFLVMGSWLITRRLTPDINFSRGQNLFEVLVSGVLEQIRQISQQNPQRYLPLIGTLFIFIAISNLLSVIPGFHPPTGSLSTTVALAICVFVAVPLFGISQQGLAGYVSQYIKPSPIMLPFNVIGEFSRTLALAVRLFGNVMSGTMIAGILLAIVPLFFPIVMQVLGLLTGLIQAYIFAVLAMVYIASGTRPHHGRKSKKSEEGDE
jgi:F-type H+-transporting ATPase subunit a